MEGDRLGDMENVNGTVLCAVVAFVVALFFFHREVREAIENFKDNLPRGGPRTPMHPSPVTDAALLRRRAPKKAQS